MTTHDKANIGVFIVAVAIIASGVMFRVLNTNEAGKALSSSESSIDVASLQTFGDEAIAKKAEALRLEKEAIAAEKAAEEARIAEEKAEAERLEQERLVAEQSQNTFSPPVNADTGSGGETPVSSPIVAATGPGYSFVNQVRADNGKTALGQDETLEASAYSYAQTLATGCQPLVHFDISTLLGVNISGGPIVSVAENIAYNGTLNAALVSLKNSPGHFANMIANYNYVGIGAVTATDPGCSGRLYVVMQFART